MAGLQADQASHHTASGLSAAARAWHNQYFARERGMKFASFMQDGQPGWGLVTDETLLRPVPPEAPWSDLPGALAAGGLAEAARLARGQASLPLDEVVLLPPVPAPGKVLCVGINYLPHIREMGREPPRHPVIFVRFADSFTGHGAGLVHPGISTEYDYEGELALVIGRPAYRIGRAAALDHVAGYTCLMDGSVRDWQKHTSQFTPGKNFPGSGSIGPWLVSRDELPELSGRRLETRISGQLMQSADLGEMCFDVPAIVEYCASFCQLNPGDIISTGTPGGVGFARKPPRWLQVGDQVEVAIEGIGTLRNTVVGADPGSAAG